MNNTSPIRPETKFSKELIYQQLQKIFSDPFFSNSDILRKFLTFIVDQTLSGHANWLKEYTIGVNVLNKSADFKPQDNGIVRIHAGRLRRALHHYYNSIGALDAIHISIPKGGYIPVFNEAGSLLANEEPDNTGKALADSPSENLAKKPSALAVIPFQHFHNTPLENSLVDGLGLQLSNELMQFEKYPVIAYYTMRDLWKKTSDISKVALFVDAKYVIAGSLQILENKVRSHIQLIDSYTNRQVWSCMYEGEFAAENIFRLQDEIVKFIISELIKSRKLTEDKKQRTSMIAVA